MGNIIETIKNPTDIAHLVCKAAETEQDEIIEKNKKRIERFQEPLSVPAYNVKRMLENIKKLTEETFAQPRFQEYANEHSWNGKSSKKDWIEIATTILRDRYLVPFAQDDADLFQQLCEIWPELIPQPKLTKEQRVELANLQKQADNIIERATGLVTELSKLAEQEKDIIRNTASKYDERVADQFKYVNVNLQYYKDYVKKW